MSSDDAPRSFFRRPFRTPNPAPAAAAPAKAAPAATLTGRLSSEWRHLEGRIHSAPTAADPASLHLEVGEFLRLWGVEVAQCQAHEQAPLASLLESARASLLSQLALAAEAFRAAGWRDAEARQRQAVEQARHDQRLEAGQAEIRRIQNETARIQEETRRSHQAAVDRNHLLARAALFPENHCPYCSRSYLDLVGGCWHCQHLHRPGHF